MRYTLLFLLMLVTLMGLGQIQILKTNNIGLIVKADYSHDNKYPPILIVEESPAAAVLSKDAAKELVSINGWSCSKKTFDEINKHLIAPKGTVIKLVVTDGETRYATKTTYEVTCVDIIYAQESGTLVTCLSGDCIDGPSTYAINGGCTVITTMNKGYGYGPVTLDCPESYTWAHVEGTYNKSELTGTAKFTFVDNHTEEGTVNNGHLFGEIIYTYPDGKKVKGERYGQWGKYLTLPDTAKPQPITITNPIASKSTYTPTTPTVDNSPGALIRTLGDGMKTRIEEGYTLVKEEYSDKGQNFSIDFPVHWEYNYKFSVLYYEDKASSPDVYFYYGTDRSNHFPLDRKSLSSGVGMYAGFIKPDINNTGNVTYSDVNSNGTNKVLIQVYRKSK